MSTIISIVVQINDWAKKLNDRVSTQQVAGLHLQLSYNSHTPWANSQAVKASIEKHIVNMNILFLCTGNSCRSQMAEGWARHLAGARITVQSAGLEAHGKNPRAIAVMAEAGIDISSQESTVLTAEMLQQADVLVTVCGHADEHCPVLPAGKQKRHWPLSDPAKAKGTETEIMDQFRATRDEVSERVVDLLQDLLKK